MQLADQSGEVSSVARALEGVRGPFPHLIEHIAELTADPDDASLQRWIARGFVREAEHWPSMVGGGLIVMHAPGVETGGRERVLQRFALHLGKRGRVTAAFLYTYSPVPRTVRGMALERITWTRRGGAQRAFAIEPLERTGARR